jgi:hypothetical protein
MALLPIIPISDFGRPEGTRISDLFVDWSIVSSSTLVAFDLVIVAITSSMHARRTKPQQIRNPKSEIRNTKRPSST